MCEAVADRAWHAARLAFSRLSLEESGLVTARREGRAESRRRLPCSRQQPVSRQSVVRASWGASLSGIILTRPATTALVLRRDAGPSRSGFGSTRAFHIQSGSQATALEYNRPAPLVHRSHDRTDARAKLPGAGSCRILVRSYAQPLKSRLPHRPAIGSLSSPP